jgi:hypothetical protein
MRSLGVTAVEAYCKCGHEASIDVLGLPGDVAVPEIKNRLRCTKCGERPMETRPDWTKPGKGQVGAVIRKQKETAGTAEDYCFYSLLPNFGHNDFVIASGKTRGFHSSSSTR